MAEYENKFNSNEYELEAQDQYFDTGSGELLDSKELSIFQKIKLIAQQMGYDINDPKKDCRKCWGRGYTGLKKDTKEPVLCSCIFKPEDRKNMQQAPNQKMSRAQRRRMDKIMRQRMKRVNVNKIIEQVKREHGESTDG